MLSTQNKERILKVSKEKYQDMYKYNLIRIIANFSAETVKARKTWNYVLQPLKENNCQARLLYSAELFFIIEEIKTFHNKQN
jgi:hypothetical protein